MSATCAVCGASTVPAGAKRSDWSGVEFALRHCETCRFSFVANPRTDFDAVYDAAYYAGKGADPLVDYVEEMTNPRTIRAYEWDGVVRLVTHLLGTRNVAWLDFGAGLGGLVRHARNAGVERIVGFDEYWSAAWMHGHDIPTVTADDLDARAGSFDVVTAIEVLEHVTDPVGLLRRVEALLRPGGVFVLTTGNARPFRDRLPKWSYVMPDVHVSFFEPETLSRAYTQVGLRPVVPGFVPGFDGIIRYKMLKSMRLDSRNVAERLVPWRPVTRLVDRRYGVTAQPFGWKGA